MVRFQIWQPLFRILAQQKPRHFLSKIYAFWFFHKILLIDKFEVVDFKYHNIFLNSNSKIPKPEFFGPKFKDFYLCNKTNSRALISNMTIVFQICCAKHPNKALLVVNLRISFFCTKFESFDFKYDNILLKFQPKNTQIKHFWSQS